MKLRSVLSIAALRPIPPAGEFTIDYAITSEAGGQGRAPVRGDVRTRVAIDGPNFQIRQRGHLESSSDDGATTWFDDDRTTTQSPLIAPGAIAAATAPIVGRVEDEQLVVGLSRDGPAYFGLPTRVYTVDYHYSIAGRVLVFPFRAQATHAQYTMTVVDLGESNAAVRVFLSRGYHYPLSQHAEAFTGIPVRIDATIDSEGSHVVFHAEASSLGR